MRPWYRLAVFHYHQGYFSASVEPTYIGSADRFPEVPPLTATQHEALALVQGLADELHFDMDFKPGDIQFLHNHVIFHSRTAFEDHPEPERKRQLLRPWLKVMDGRPLPPPFYERHGPIDEVRRPGGIVGADTVLTAPLEAE